MGFELRIEGSGEVVRTEGQEEGRYMLQAEEIHEETSSPDSKTQDREGVIRPRLPQVPGTCFIFEALLNLFFFFVCVSLKN